MESERKEALGAATGSAAHAHAWQYEKKKYARTGIRTCTICGRLERQVHIGTRRTGMWWSNWELIRETQPGFPLSPNNQVSGGGAAGSPTANADAPRRPLD